MPSDDPFFDETFVRRFNRRRREDDSVNTCIDEPSIVQRVKALSPRHAIELGCGTGGLTAALANYCTSVVSVDQSPLMLERAAAEVIGKNVQFVCSSFEQFEPTSKADVVVSGMAMHLVSDLSHLCRLVHTWLEPGGTFMFSQRHPIRTACPTGDGGSPAVPSWTVSQYFDTGSRTYDWLGFEVRYVHRTVSDIVSCAISSGFTLQELVEPEPAYHLSTTRDAENRSTPSVLLLVCKKPNESEGA